MWQDLCWPKPTYPSLSLAFIRGEKRGKKRETKTTLGEETETGGERREHQKKKEHAFHKTRAAELFEVGLSRASGSLS